MIEMPGLGCSVLRLARRIGAGVKVVGLSVQGKVVV